MERSTLQVVVDTASIDRFHERLNEHRRSDDFFAVAGHPTMEARSTRVVPVEGAHAQVFGDLTLLGVTREIVLDVTLNELGPHPMSGQEHVGFSATARSSAWTTPRRPWAATWCSPSTGSSRRPRRPRTEPRPVVLEHPLLSVRAGETEAFEAAFAGASALLARQAGYRSHRLEDHTEGFRGGPDDPEWKARLHSFYEPFPEVLHFESVVRGASES